MVMTREAPANRKAIDFKCIDNIPQELKDKYEKRVKEINGEHPVSAYFILDTELMPGEDDWALCVSKTLKYSIKKGKNIRLPTDNVMGKVISFNTNVSYV